MIDAFVRLQSIKRDVKISRGTHLLHLERSRFAPYREAQLFLAGEDEPSPATEEQYAMAATDRSSIHIQENGR
jgi:hypothetical protein